MIIEFLGFHQFYQTFFFFFFVKGYIDFASTDSAETGRIKTTYRFHHQLIFTHITVDYEKNFLLSKLVEIDHYNGFDNSVKFS